ncbi:hypothetical protein HYZ41_01350 [archaeon]|nr:hypothetical protein [archaeon]
MGHDTARAKIRDLERRMELVRTMHSTGKMPIKTAKKMMLDMHRQINTHLNDLPVHERELYLIKREFGHI